MLTIDELEEQLLVMQDDLALAEEEIFNLKQEIERMRTLD